MKFLNFPLKAILLAGSLAVLASCEKGDVPEPMGDAGSTFVRIPPSEGFKLVSIDVLTTPQTFGVIDVYRDVPNEGALNSTTKVVITEDASLITAYNADNGTDYIPLPTTAFTIDPSNPKVGNDYTLTFAPGEFYKQLKITVPNSTTLDPTKHYAMAFKITSVDNQGKISASQQAVVVEVGIKNQWDGTYKSTGVFHHPTAGDRAINEGKVLSTTGTNSVRTTLGDLGSSGYYMILTINANNTVTITPSGVTPNVDQSWGPNYYDPATKTFHLHYSYNTAAPRIIEETLVRQ